MASQPKMPASNNGRHLISVTKDVMLVLYEYRQQLEDKLKIDVSWSQTIQHLVNNRKDK